jgi:hypothetical protein
MQMTPRRLHTGPATRCGRDTCTNRCRRRIELLLVRGCGRTAVHTCAYTAGRRANALVTAMTCWWVCAGPSPSAGSQQSASGCVTHVSPRIFPCERGHQDSICTWSRHAADAGRGWSGVVAACCLPASCTASATSLVIGPGPRNRRGPRPLGGC